MSRDVVQEEDQHYWQGAWHAIVGLEPLPENAMLLKGSPAFENYLRGYNDTNQ